MAAMPYYKQKFERLEYPEHMRSVVADAERLFDHEAFYGFKGYSDDASISRLSWQKGAERMVVNMVDNGLIIAVEHGQVSGKVLERTHEPFLLRDYRRATLAIGLGEASTYFSNPDQMNTKTDAAISPGVNKLGPYWKRYDYTKEFLIVRNRAFGKLGLEWVLAS
jgi:hypothetical protein